LIIDLSEATFARLVSRACNLALDVKITQDASLEITVDGIDSTRSVFGFLLEKGRDDGHMLKLTMTGSLK
jgi:hypothetical protein